MNKASTPAMDDKSRAEATVMLFNVTMAPSTAAINDTRPRRSVLQYLNEKEAAGYTSECIYYLDLSIDIKLWKYEGSKYKEITGTAKVKTPL